MDENFPLRKVLQLRNLKVCKTLILCLQHHTPYKIFSIHYDMNLSC